jgi:DNA-binding GntR family transcriptional regulator
MAEEDVLAPLVRSPALMERRSMSEHIAISLRDAIRSGALPDGTELNQMSLAAHYGVSRVPVREAMLQLQAEGWITNRLHQRAVVRGISSDRIAEMLEIRTTLECSLIERAIPKMTEHTLSRLEDLCNTMEKSADHDAWLAANAEFHRVLYEGANRPATLELLEQLQSQIERYVRTHGRDIARERDAMAEHRDIIANVRAGSAESSQRLLRLHIGHTLERFQASSDNVDRKIDATAS